MENKQIWLTVLVSIAVALAVALIVVASSGPLLGPETKTEVNANRCQADGICEVNALNGPAGVTKILGNSEIVGDLNLVGKLSGLDCAVFLLNDTGVRTCNNAGYTICVAQESKYTTRYHDSINGSCLGRVQVQMEDYSLVTCTEFGGGGNTNCGRNTQGTEPYYGDITTSYVLPTGNVLCCK